MQSVQRFKSYIMKLVAIFELVDAEGVAALLLQLHQRTHGGVDDAGIHIRSEVFYAVAVRKAYV
ncbi:hypothetical protein SDC9_88212 [bioreactor metagenome]|uniref:Uncharacterized protein n=1 Tax=bioreactor metagenome TaxID=1076179 RepID=A0A644ZLG9_9ZZZZ